MTRILSLESRINWRYWRNAVLYDLDMSARGKGRPTELSRPLQSFIREELGRIDPREMFKFTRYLASVYGVSHRTMRRIAGVEVVGLTVTESAWDNNREVSTA